MHTAGSSVLGLSARCRIIFSGTGVYQEIFDEIVLQAMRRKLIDGKTLYTDATHLKANANKNRHEKKFVEKSIRSYLEELDADIAREREADIAREREAHGKKPLKPKDEPPEKKKIKSSTNDPDSGYMVRDGKPDMFKKRDFVYDEYYDCYLCPAGQVLNYSTTNREGFHEYKSTDSICAQCPRLNECTRSRNHVKVITRHVWETHKEKVDDQRLTPKGKRIYKRRKETVERSFADAKELHGHRYTRLREIAKVQEQCLMAACAQNLKKIALILAREGHDRAERRLDRLWKLLRATLIHLFEIITPNKMKPSIRQRSSPEHRK